MTGASRRRSGPPAELAGGEASGLTVVHLVRHAKAGSRSRFDGDDALRPLSGSGRRQAEAIGERFAKGDAEAGGVKAAVSSPSARCVQTLEPLARRHGLTITTLESLAEGSDPVAALTGLVHLAASGSVVACTHGDVTMGAVWHLLGAGVEVDGPPESPKASTWELLVARGEIVRARYVPPPALTT